MTLHRLRSSDEIFTLIVGEKETRPLSTNFISQFTRRDVKSGFLHNKLCELFINGIIKSRYY